MDSPREPPQPGVATPNAALDYLHAALTQLRALAAQPDADPFHAQAAEQVAAIVTGLQSRTAPTFGDPLPCHPR